MNAAEHLKEIDRLDNFAGLCILYVFGAQVMDKFGEAHESIFSRGESGRLNSLSVVLSQEIDRFNRLTKQMQTSLKELQKAIKGLVVMSDELEQMLHSMLDSKVCVHTWNLA